VTYERGTRVSARAWRRNGTEMAPQEAEAQADRDAAADDVALAALQALVTSHVPACESATPTPASSLTLPPQLG
jgi:uncharacterized membrane protein